MSKFDSRRVNRRADAQRNASGIVEAAITVLGRTPEASVDDIAAAAGVRRQTVYAHFPSRQVLLDAVVERITADVAAALDSVEAKESSAVLALRRWLDVAWSLIERYPVLLTSAMPMPAAQQEADRHAPILSRLSAIIRRGRRSGEFVPGLSTGWLTAAVIALGHAAGAEVAAGRMTSRRAGAAFTESVLRVCGVAAPRVPD